LNTFVLTQHKTNTRKYHVQLFKKLQNTTTKHHLVTNGTLVTVNTDYDKLRGMRKKSNWILSTHNQCTTFTN